MPRPSRSFAACLVALGILLSGVIVPAAGCCMRGGDCCPPAGRNVAAAAARAEASSPDCCQIKQDPIPVRPPAPAAVRADHIQGQTAVLTSIPAVELAEQTAPRLMTFHGESGATTPSHGNRAPPPSPAV